MQMDGVDLDADGCSVSLDGSNPTALTVGQSVHYSGLQPGSHTVQLGDLADNCELSGTDIRTVTVVAGDTVAVVFAATCARIVGLAFLVQPSDMEIGEVLSPAVQVATHDASGTIIADAATQITVRARDEGEQVILTWSSSVVDGTAIFDDIRILTVGGYSLEATAAGAAPAISDPFSITYPPIAYNSFAGADTRDVFLLSGTAILNLTNHPAEDYQPAWSPDGEKIAFASDRDGDFDIYIMNADGSGVTQLTDDPAWDEHPSWSPDGSSIVFASSRDGMNICIMDADGSDVVCIADGRGVNHSPDWSPDGTRIAWIGPGVESPELCVMRVDGSSGQCLTENARHEEQPRWSPAGTRIAFYAWEEDFSYDVHVIDADGSNDVNLTTSPGVHDVTPDWSPHGSRLVFGNHRNSGAGLYLMNPDGSDVIQLTTDGGYSPAWRPLP
jgi:Tol biopolymer transport system component